MTNIVIGPINSVFIIIIIIILYFASHMITYMYVQFLNSHSWIAE